MTDCAGCGGSNRDGAKFSASCGGSLAAPVLECPSCASPYEAGQRFCDECGAGLEATPAATATPTPVRYEVVRLLGEGARKLVHLARDTVLGREVALSTFKTEGVDADAIVRARREAEAMARLGDHPNIVTVHDIGGGEGNGDLYLVSQVMQGGDLADHKAAAQHGRLDVAEVVRLGTQIASALEHAHKHGIVHRDLKPQNVWLTDDGTAKLGDFGLASNLDASKLTAEGSIVGTVAYMSPEQGLGQQADPRSDLYSLGAVLYELLCGAPPFSGGDAASVISQHVSAVPVAPSWHRDDVPDALEEVVLRLLAKAPADRFQAASDVREALSAITDVAAGEGRQDAATAALDRLLGGPFFGRDSELGDLRSAVDEAIAGRGRLVMIAGDAGMGKTRLAAEVERYAGLRGALVLWGRSYEGEGTPAYWPWIQVIRTYAKTRDKEALLAELGSGVSDVAQVVSELRSQLPELPAPHELDPEQSQFQLFDSITTFLRNASHGRPLVIVLEDLHVADLPSLQLLQFLVREVPAARILVVATYRDSELAAGHPLPDIDAAMARERGYQRMRLRPLDREEVHGLLESISRQPLTSVDERAMTAAVHRESGGNPFFIEEIVRHLVETGTIYERDGKWQSDVRRIEDLGIPRGIRDAIDRRLSRLSAECRELLSTASVFGYEMRVELLARTADLPSDVVVGRVLEAVDAGVLAAHPDDPGSYRFVHVVTRDALYDAVPQAARAPLHRTIGELLEAQYGDRVERHLDELAHHFANAAALGLAAKAGDYAQRAGERAAGLAAHGDAAEHFARALQLLGGDADPARRCELLLSLGESRMRADEVDAARKVFVDAAALAESIGDADAYARAAVGYGGQAGGLAASDRADTKVLHMLRTALRLLPDDDSALRVRVMSRLAVELSLADDASAPEAMSRAAVEMAERLDDDRLRLHARYSRQWATMGPDGVAESAAEAAEVVRLARELGDAEMEFHGHHLRVHTLLKLGDVAGMDRELRACERLAAALRQPVFEWQVTAFRAMRALMDGRFADGEQLANEALVLGQRGHADVAAIVYGSQAFLGAWATGRLGELVDGAEALASGYPDSAWPAARTMLVSEVGDLDRARAGFEPFARDGFRRLRRDSNWLTATGCLAMACNTLGDKDAAEVLYDLLSPYAELTTSVLTASAALGSNHFFCGLLAETAGRLDIAIDHFTKGIDVHTRTGARFLLPRLHYVLARALLARDGDGDQARAGELVEEGLQLARVLGTPPEVEHLLSLRLAHAGLADLDPQLSIVSVATSVERARPDLGRATAPDGTVTIMFSDIEGSTTLTDQLGDRRWLELLAVHNGIVRDAVARHEGYEVKSQGDGFMLAFASGLKAIHCACDIQHALAAHRREHPEAPLHVRIGLHTGEALRAEEDFFGRNVILAARIAAQAHGDEILVSALLRELVASSGDFRFGPEQELDLKGLPGRHRVASVRWADVGELVIPLPPILANVPDAPCVGRDAELARIRAVIDRAPERGVGVVLIGSATGYGKSRLAAEAARAAADDGAIVTWGECEDDVGAPFQPWIQALGHLVAHLPDAVLAGHVSRRGGALARLVPALAGRVSDLPSTTALLDPEDERNVLAASAVDLLAAAASLATVVVVIDDLHWADDASLWLLGEVTKEPTSRVVLVLTYRTPLGPDNAATATVGELARRPGAEEMELTNGEPASVTGAEDVGAHVIALHPHATLVLGAAAVIGRRFDVDVARAVAGDTARVDEVLEAATAAGLVLPVDDGRVAFAQALVHETLYDAQPPTMRDRAHRLAAEAIEARGGSVNDIAHHWASCTLNTDVGRALRHLLAAGRAALDAMSPRDALRWFERASELADRQPNIHPSLRCDLLLGLGEAQRRAGENRYRTTLLEAARIARADDDPVRLAAATLANTRGWANVTGTVDAERVDALQASLAAGDRLDDQTRARLLALLALEDAYSGDLDRRKAWSDEALELAHATGDDPTLVYVLMRRYRTIWAPATYPERAETVREFEEVADRLGDPGAQMAAANWRWLLATEVGDMEAADAALEHRTALAQSVGRRGDTWEMLFQRSARSYIAGKLDDAEALATRAAQIGAHQPDAGPYFAGQLVAVRYDQGRLPEIADLFADVAAQNEGISTFDAALTLLRCELGQMDEARRLTDAAHGRDFAKVPTDNLWLTTMAAYADAASQLQHVEAAQSLYALLEPYGDRLAVNGININGAIARYLALLAATLGDLPLAESHFTSAVEIHERVGAPVFLARTRMEWAEALIALGGSAGALRAGRLLEQALIGARAYGCVALEARILSVLG